MSVAHGISDPQARPGAGKTGQIGSVPSRRKRLVMGGRGGGVHAGEAVYSRALERDRNWEEMADEF